MSFFKSLFQDGINSTDPAKRIAAIDALAAKGGADAATKIGTALNDPDHMVARKAADALARLRTPAAQDALGQALNKALAGRAGPPEPYEHELSQNYWLEHLAETLAAFGPAAAPQLIAMLQNREIELRNRPYVLYGAGAARGAEHLGKMFYAGAASALIDRLKDPIESAIIYLTHPARFANIPSLWKSKPTSRAVFSKPSSTLLALITASCSFRNSAGLTA